MGRQRRSPEQIIGKLREAEVLQGNGNLVYPATQFIVAELILG